MDLSRLLAPTSVAVVGATDRPGSYGGAALRNLLEAGFAGRLIGVNPGRSAVLGVPCVSSLADLGGPVDAVVVATPADTVPDVLDQAGALGCGGAIVFAAEFAETGRTDRQDALVSAAARHVLPVIGPNANGAVCLHSRAPMWGDTVRTGPPGSVAFVSQSGNLGVLALASRRGLDWHTVVSVGNSAVVDATAVLHHLADAPDVRSVALYLEDDGDGSRWAQALAACADHGTRVAVLKAGHSAAGAAAGGAHTAAVAGDHRVFEALVREAGSAWCHDPHELFETAKALAAPRPARAGGLAVVTCSGGDAVTAADDAERLGVPLAAFSDDTVVRLQRLLPPGVVVTNPLDHTNALWDDTQRITALVDALADDPGVAQVLYVQDTPHDLPDDVAAEWARTRDGVVLAAPGTPRAVVAALPELMPEDVAESLTARGVIPFLGISEALKALHANAAPPADAARLRAVAGAAAGSRHAPGDWLSEHEGKRLLARHGVPVPRGATAATVDDAVATAAALGGPVAVKLSHAGIQHKSDLGGLALDLTEPDAVAAAATRILALDPDGEVLVEAMGEAGVELLVSVSRDGVVPHLVVGLGGIWTELVDDVTILPLPVDAAAVRDGLMRLRGASLLTGGRGGGALDVDAAAALAVAAAEAFHSERLSLVELNPVIVTATGALAVDAVVRRQA